MTITIEGEMIRRTEEIIKTLQKALAQKIKGDIEFYQTISQGVEIEEGKSIAQATVYLMYTRHIAILTDEIFIS